MRHLINGHHNDVEAYLLWLRHQLDVLVTNLPTGDTSTTDLVEPIFAQLLTTTSKRLRRSVKDWHLAYHNTEKAFTASSLVQLAEKTCKALRCTGQLYIDNDPELAVLHAKISQQDLATQAFKVITNTQQNHTTTTTTRSHTKNGNNHGGTHNRPPKPDWYYKPPLHPNDTHQHDGRDWYWCPKCGRNQQGKWVCTHLPAEHKDTFVKKRKNEQGPAQTKQAKTPTMPTAGTSATFTQANLAQLAQAHAQLTALLAAAPTLALPQSTTPVTRHTTQPIGSLNDNAHDLLDLDGW
jgi:hypothetical protein